jgi:hypothetical protein
MVQDTQVVSISQWESEEHAKAADAALGEGQHHHAERDALHRRALLARARGSVGRQPKLTIGSEARWAPEPVSAQLGGSPQSSTSAYPCTTRVIDYPNHGRLLAWRLDAVGWRSSVPYAVRATLRHLKR